MTVTIASGFISIPFLTIIDTGKGLGGVLIDQRTSNVTTIISMTLAVVALLFANLSVKDGRTYSLLFAHSRLYFILYYILSVIFLLILLSTLRQILTPDFFERAVIGITYLALSILVCIGYLFRIFINFVNSNRLEQILKIELYKEAQRNIRINLVSKYSAAEFLAIMKAYNVYQCPAPNSLVKNNSIETKLIYDIDLKILKKKLSKSNFNGDTYVCLPFAINEISNRYENFIFRYKNEHASEFTHFAQCIKLRSISKQLKMANDNLAYFDEKLREYAHNGKSSKVRQVLAIYRDLYSLQMKHS